MWLLDCTNTTASVAAAHCNTRLDRTDWPNTTKASHWRHVAHGRPHSANNSLTATPPNHYKLLPAICNTSRTRVCSGSSSVCQHKYEHTHESEAAKRARSNEWTLEYAGVGVGTSPVVSELAKRDWGGERCRERERMCLCSIK